MYTIQTNPTGTRSMEISDEHLQTIEKYSLFQHLIDSNGIVDESVLDKLKLNLRSLIASSEANSKDLLDLCIDVIYHNNMKAFGLHQLILLYIDWQRRKELSGNENVGNATTPPHRLASHHQEGSRTEGMGRTGCHPIQR